ncbi:hypothetical protein [Novispirillum itersonii]|uniref:hypothetical protein n=1 Tax=Novispirillum itersonii TaxID=189 RepID=UPI0003816EF5|nr:hypothetical protein [Novispirillum itersonii]
MALIYQASFGGGELAPSLWSRVDLAKYAEGLKTCRNFFIAAHGGAYSRPGLRFIAEARNSTRPVRLIPFQFSTVQTYVLEWGHLYLRVHKDGAPVLEGDKAVTASGAELTAAAHGWAVGDDLFLEGVSGGGNSRTVRITAVTANTATVSALDGGALALTGSGTAARVYTLTTPYSADQIFRLNVVQSADVMTLCHPDHPPRELRRTGHTAWTLTDITFVPRQVPPTGLSATPINSGSEQYSYAVTAVNADDAEESPPAYVGLSSAASAAWKNQINWVAAPGADTYNIYRQKAGTYGFVGRSKTTGFVDDNIAPDLGDGPPNPRNPFVGAGNYPQAVAYYQQRRVFAGSAAKPQTVWLSVSSAYNNFSVSTPTKDDDAITLTIAAQRVNEVRHLVPLTSLIALTSGGEFTIGPGSQSDPLTPSNIQTRPQGYRGAAHTPPLVVGNTVLYVQAQGGIIRDLGYDYTSDSFTGNDLSVLANHLFSGHTLTDWAYAQTPYSIIWAVREDGTLLGLTYMKEQKVWAWHRHDTDGLFESVATIPEGNEDGVYVVVRRTVNGVTRRYIERFATRVITTVQDCFCVDSGLTYSGPAVSTVSGLWHLEGKAVSVLADGNVVAGQTVTNGRITLLQPSTTVHVGLPYTCDLQTLDIEMASVGTIQGRDKRVVGLTVRMENTRGLAVGKEGSLTEMRVDPSVIANPLPLETGDYRFALPPGWSTGSSVLIRQTYPLPAGVMAIVPEIDVA